MFRDWRLWTPATRAAALARTPRQTGGLPPSAAIGVIRRRIAELRQHIAHARTVEQRMEAVTHEVEDMILAIVAEDGHGAETRSMAGPGAYLNP
jgi:hypothetical protein